MRRAVPAEIKPHAAEYDIAWRLVQNEPLGVVGKIAVDNALGGCPFAEDIAIEKHAAVHLAVTLLYFLGQGQVVVHGEMEVQQALLAALVYPFPLEPMRGTCGVAIEPEL